MYQCSWGTDSGDGELELNFKPHNQSVSPANAEPRCYKPERMLR